MIEKYTLDLLTRDSVSVKKQTYMEYMEQLYPIGEPWRRAYVNNESGRKQIVDELPQTEVNAIMAMWGNTPTIADVSA